MTSAAASPLLPRAPYTPATRRQRRKADAWMAYGFMAPAAILVAALMYWPMIDTFRESLYTTSFINPTPNFVGLETYRQIFGDETFWQVVRNSIVWTAGVVLLQNVGGFLIALLLNQRLPFQGALRSLVLLPWVLPGVVAAILWRFMYDPQLGLINSFLIRLGIIRPGHRLAGRSVDRHGRGDLRRLLEGLSVLERGLPRRPAERRSGAGRGGDDRRRRQASPPDRRDAPGDPPGSGGQRAAHHDPHLQLFRHHLRADARRSAQRDRHLPHAHLRARLRPVPLRRGGGLWFARGAGAGAVRRASPSPPAAPPERTA